MPALLPYGPLGKQTAHLCVDMQTMFAERSDWHVPWMERVLPGVIRLAKAHVHNSIFTRFVPLPGRRMHPAPGAAITGVGSI
jgi:nicotinamidase-related amidase